MGNIFSDPIEMSVLFCLRIVVSFTRMGWHRQYQYCAGPGQDKNTYLARQNVYFIFGLEMAEIPLLKTLKDVCTLK